MLNIEDRVGAAYLLLTDVVTSSHRHNFASLPFGGAGLEG